MPATRRASLDIAALREHVSSLQPRSSRMNSHQARQHGTVGTRPTRASSYVPLRAFTHPEGHTINAHHARGTSKGRQDSAIK